MKARIAIALLAALSVSACSGISVNQDFSPGANYSGLTTWDWMPAADREGGDARATNPLLHGRIQSAVETQMQAKGFRKVDSGEVSFRVGYHLILEDRVDYQTVNNYYGGGWGYRGVYGRYGPGMGTSQTYAREYTDGTLIIDFYDVAARELVWRGSAEGRINESADPLEQQERANLAIQKILEQFPPGG
jgi:hypothetical protein